MTDRNISKESRKGRGINFYNFFFFAVIPIIVTVILLIKTIVVYRSILIIDAKELENVIINSNWMDIGFSVISIAVSVWLGINIANLVDKKQIDDLNNKTEELGSIINDSEERLINGEKNISILEDDIKNINNDIENRFYKTKFLDQLMKTSELYESSLYLYEIFYENDEEEYQELYKIEDKYLDCIKAYETADWTETYSYSIEGLNLFEKFKEKHREYYFLRKSDFLFYKNVSLTHNNTLGEFSKEELEESISLYKKEINFLNENPEKQRLIGYLYNTIGYSYDILQVRSKDEDDKKKYSDLSINNMDIAVRYNDKGRYYRNLGLTYQHKGNLEKAKECYKIAFVKNPKDYKAYNNILAIILEELDIKFNINKRFEHNVLLSELDGINNLENICLLDELKEINKYREFAEKSNCWFEDIYYNTCKMYMYLYIFSNYRRTEYIERAIEYGKKALFLNEESNGGKFCLRNAYECYNNLEEAKKINDELVNVGDSKKADEFYSRKIMERDKKTETPSKN